MGKLSTIVKTLDFVLKDAKKSKLDEGTINELVQIERKASMIKHILKIQGTLGTKQNKKVLEFKLEIDKKEEELNKLKEEANKLQKIQPLTKKDSDKLNNINKKIKNEEVILIKIKNKLKEEKMNLKK